MMRLLAFSAWQKILIIRSYLQKLTRLRNPLMIIVSILSAMIFWMWVTSTQGPCSDFTKQAKPYMSVLRAKHCLNVSNTTNIMLYEAAKQLDY